MTDQNTTESAPVKEDKFAFGEVARIHHDSALLVSRGDMLDRLVTLAREARNVDIVEIKAPEGVQGVPATVPAFLLHGATPTLKPVAEFFEPFRTQPQRRKRTATVDTLASFTDLVNRQKDADSVIFASSGWPNIKLTAVLDYNRGPDGEQKHQPRFGQHKIEYPFPLTTEFKAWMDHNGKPFKQLDFAHFLEDRVAELAAPTAGEESEYERQFQVRIATPIELVTLSRDLEVNVSAKYKQQTRLQSGERTIVFESEHTNSQGEKVNIPGVFMISVPAWNGGDPVRIPARLRYRVNGSEITWFYDLYRADYWLQQQVITDAETAGRDTELPVYFGKPEGA